MLLDREPFLKNTRGTPLDTAGMDERTPFNIFLFAFYVDHLTPRTFRNHPWQDT